MRALSAFSAVCLALSAAAAALAQSSEPRIALVVGVSSYEHAPSLLNPHNDARLMSDTLVDLDFDVQLLQDPTQRSFEDAVIDFKNRVQAAGPDAIALFYYAGHGIQASGVNYLIPKDASLDSQDELATRAVETNWILGMMDAAGAAMSVVILDACRNDPFTRSWVSSTRSADARGLAQMEPPRGVALMYATEPGSVALDGTGDNSPFADTLAREMRTPGVLAETMFKRVVAGVRDSTSGDQHPFLEMSFTGDFYLGGPPADGGTEAGLGDADEFFWNIIKSSSDADLFAQYLADFPDGAHVDEAQAKLDELEAAADPSANFRVVDASLAPATEEYAGRCPTSVQFNGVISTTGGPGVVSYRFVRSDGAQGAIQTLAFEGPGSKGVSSSWTLGSDGEGFEEWVKLEVFDPSEVSSGEASFRLACADRSVDGAGSRFEQVAELGKVDRKVLDRLNTTDRRRLAEAVIGSVRLEAPGLVAPADGQVFDIFPRDVRFEWRGVRGAASYTLEVDVWGACAGGRWCSDVGTDRTTKYDGLTATSHTAGFVGAQPGRWRVQAVNSDGSIGAMSEWREFLHKR